MRRREMLLSSSAALMAARNQNPLRAQTDQPSPSPGISPAALEEDLLAGPASGPWRRLFLDATVVEQQHGLKRVFHAAEKHADNPILVADRAWEGVSAITGPYVYGTVLREKSTLRMWYQLLFEGNHIGYAESVDGLHWTKPDLDVIRYQDARTNLVVSAFDLDLSGGGNCHNPSVILRSSDPDPERRYALYGFDGNLGQPRVAFSADGLHWRFPPVSKNQPLFSSSDVVNFFYDPYQSRYFCTWKTRNRRGRAVGIASSVDGLQWTKPYDGPVFVADDLDPDATQIYGMPAFSYQGLYMGLPWIYRARYFRYGEYSVEKLHEAQADSPRTMEVQLAWSWDLMNWTRPAAREQFIPRGAEGSWDDGIIVTARAPVVVGDQLYFYFGGADKVHDEKRARAAIGLATLRLDGFCSMSARGSQEGWLITRREPFHQPAVVINARTLAGGWLTAEILDRNGQTLEGFSHSDCIPFTGDATRYELRWSKSQFESRQKRDDYKLRFRLYNADLFSYLPTGLDPQQPDLARFQTTGP